MQIIGFDLDQTLYPRSSKIDEAIQCYIYVKIADFKGCSVEEGERLFKSYYPKISGRRTLMTLGFDAEVAYNVVQEALENAEISEFLVPNPEIHRLLMDLKNKYGALSLLTGSNRKCAIQKLESLKIDPGMFDFFASGETAKSDGTAFRKWMDFYKDVPAENFVYIGDRPVTDVDIPQSMGMKAILVNVKEKDENLDVMQFTSVLDIRSVLL